MLEAIDPGVLTLWTEEDESSTTPTHRTPTPTPTGAFSAESLHLDAEGGISLVLYTSEDGTRTVWTRDGDLGETPGGWTLYAPESVTSLSSSFGIPEHTRNTDDEAVLIMTTSAQGQAMVDDTTYGWGTYPLGALQGSVDHYRGVHAARLSDGTAVVGWWGQRRDGHRLLRRGRSRRGTRPASTPTGCGTWVSRQTTRWSRSTSSTTRWSWRSGPPTGWRPWPRCPPSMWHSSSSPPTGTVYITGAEDGVLTTHIGALDGTFADPVTHDAGYISGLSTAADDSALHACFSDYDGVWVATYDATR